MDAWEQKEHLQGFSIVQKREMRPQSSQEACKTLSVMIGGLDFSLKSSGNLLDGREQEKDIKTPVLSVGLGLAHRIYQASEIFVE